MIVHLSINFPNNPGYVENALQFDTVKEAVTHFKNEVEEFANYGQVSEMTGWLYGYDPRDVSDPYPDWILSVGKHGGIMKEKA